MTPCDLIKPLLMGLMDGELTTEQNADVTRHLNRCQACRTELEELRQACDPLRTLVFEEPTEAQAERLWKSPFSRFTRNAGLLLVLVGWLVLLGFAAVEIARDRSSDTTVKLALAGIAIGFIILFLNVLIQRLKTWRTDPYKEVER